MPSYSDILFGKIALSNRLVTMRQLQECVAAQDRGRGLTLAEVMIEGGLLSPQQARRIQKAQALTQFMRAEKIFARIALDRRLADANTLRAAFQEQQRSNYRVRLAQILSERGLLRPGDVDGIVEEQLLRLAEETARIEEAGFHHESAVAADEQARKLEDMARMATDLEGSEFRAAVGPRGLLDEKALSRTMPALMVPSTAGRPDESARSRRRRKGAVSPLAGQPDRAPLDPTDLVGAVIASRYQVAEKVGEGGMGTVYRAQHCLMEKTVALKVLHPSLVSSKSSLDRFRREIRAASRFQHKNVIQLYDAGEGEGGIFYMAMEFAEGESLEELLRREQLSLDSCVDIMCQVLSAIAEAHKKGIVHRDLKSGNIMIVPGKSGEAVVKVTDFGLAKIAMDSSDPGSDVGGAGLFKTQEGVVTGTPQYMSPEQASGEPVDHRSDLYSLGVILFELITGELPFKSNTPMGFLGKHIVEPPPVPSQVAPRRGIPPALDEITLKLLEKKPADRFQDAEAALRELSRRCTPGTLSSGNGRREPAPGLRTPSSRSARRGKTRVMPSSGRDRERPPEPEPPVAMTMEVEPPSSQLPPGLEGLGVTQEAPPPGSPGAPPRQQSSKGLLLVAALLVTLLAGVVGVAIYLATRLQPQDSVAHARALLDEDPTRAVELLEAWVAEHGDDEGARLLLDDARERQRQAEFSRLVTRADELGEQWHMGTTGRAGAQKAIALYKEALGLLPDAEVQGRLQALEGELTPGPSPSTSQGEDPHAAEQRAVLAALDEAIQGKSWDQASGLLEQAQRTLGPNHPKLEYYRLYLQAEQLIPQARAARERGDLKEARRLYEQAKSIHPEAPRQLEIADELEPVLRELKVADSGRQVEQALASGLDQALGLHVQQAQRTVDAVVAQARKQGGELAQRFETRRKALADFAPLASQLGQARSAISAQEQRAAKDADTTALSDLVKQLEDMRGRCAQAIGADAQLTRGAQALIDTELERARPLLDAARAAQPRPEDQYRDRFLRLVKRLRGLPQQRETRDLIVERLDDFRSARIHPGFEHADEETKAWLLAQIKLYEHRWTIWSALGDATQWVFVPGGAWTDPRGETHQLPEHGLFMADAELTCAQWNKYLQAKNRPRPPSFPGPTDQPVVWITRDEAQRYCQWRSSQSKLLRYRLPTAAEWERAARGDKGTNFPWGDAFEDWRVRGEDHAAVAGMDLQRVRSLRLDHNDWGLWDMVGNVQEMTSDTSEDGRVVLKGGSISHSADRCGADAVSLELPKRVAQPYVGVRLVAEER